MICQIQIRGEGHMEMEQMVVSQGEFDTVIQEILSDEKYWHLNQKTNKIASSFLERLQDWLEQILSTRISDTHELAKTSDTLSIIIIVIMGVVLIILMTFIIKYVYQCINGRKKIEEILGEKITKETTPLSLLEKAKGFEVEGIYRMSIRYRYIGLLLLMHEKGLVYIEKSMTNTEIYECLKKDNYRGLEKFRLIMETFNYTWYGKNEYTLEAYEVFKANERALWDEVNANEKGHK